MPTWKEQKQTELNGVSLTVKERTDLRNRHGSLEYIVEARIGGELVTSERHSQSTWLGHCHGQLLLPDVAKRAKASRHNSHSTTENR